MPGPREVPVHHSPCSRCGKNDSMPCGYVENESGIIFSPDVGSGDWDCAFWWDDILGADAPICEYCPLIWCKECKDTVLANANAFIRQ